MTRCLPPGLKGNCKLSHAACCPEIVVVIVIVIVIESMPEHRKLQLEPRHCYLVRPPNSRRLAIFDIWPSAASLLQPDYQCQVTSRTCLGTNPSLKLRR